MAKKLFIIITVLFSAVLTTKAQVKVTARIDSAEILIGEQTSVHITVEHPQNVQPAFPKNVQQIMKKGVEVVKKETVSIKEDEPVKGTNTSDYSFTITSFAPALYYIPSMNVKVGGKVYSTNQLAIKVNDVKVDTAHVDKFFGPKEIIEPVYTWRDWMPLFFLSLLLIVCGQTIWIAARKLIAAPKIKVAKAAKKEQLLPHKEAQNEIAKLKNEYESEELSSKDYYTSLIQILRKYVSKRYGFRADEMTSYELVEHLIDLGDRQKLMAKENAEKGNALEEPIKEPDYTELREILATADLTKFAKLKTDSNEDERNLMRLSSYIETTKSDKIPVAPVEEEDNKQETPAQNPRTKKKIVLGIAITASVIVVLLIINEIFELLL